MHEKVSVELKCLSAEMYFVHVERDLVVWHIHDQNVAHRVAILNCDEKQTSWMDLQIAMAVSSLHLCDL